MGFEKSFNYDDVFLRSATVGFIAQFHRKLTWENRFDDKTSIVTVPFYYSMTGDERFLLDAFLDDTVGNRPELNIDPKPRAIVTLTNRTTKTSEFTNPNVPIQVYKDVDGQLQKTTSKYRVIPIKLTFDISISLNTEIELFKCEQSIWNLFYLYRYFKFEYNYFRLDAHMQLPDNNNTEIAREIGGLNGEDIKSIKLSVDVHTYYPVPPIQAPITSSNKKVKFKGSLWYLKNQNNQRKWLGGDNFK